MALLYIVPAGDLALDARKRAVIAAGVAEKRAKLFARLRFWLGEWFLDERLGMPYFDLLFVKNPNLKVVERMFRSAILKTPGVTEITEFAMVLDRRERLLLVTFEAAYDDGEVVTVTEQEPFIISAEAA